MQNNLRGIPLVLAVLIAVGTLAGLVGTYKRFHVEARNRRVELALEWAEVSQLAQTSHQPLNKVLARFRAQNISTLILSEDTLASLEQAGAAQLRRIPAPGGGFGTLVTLYDAPTEARITAALAAHQIPLERILYRPETAHVLPGTTWFVRNDAPEPQKPGFVVPMDYTNLRTLGLGLPPEEVRTAQAAGLRIAGRIGNFPGVDTASAAAVLRNLHSQGATIVIFNGDDVLGYRGLEPQVAALLRAPAPDQVAMAAPTPWIGLIYGAVEFGKQRGDERLSAALRGDYVRVHSIQAAEMGQMNENEAIERFVRAARERNIRFCYVRLLTFAGSDPIEENLAYLKKIVRGMEHGSPATGGGLEFGAAQPFGETGVSSLWFALIALGAAAGTVWMLRAFCPLPERWQAVLLVALCVICVGLAVGTGDMGRKLVALLAGIAFPAVACLRTFPQPDERLRVSVGRQPADRDRAEKRLCVVRATQRLALASAITALGIVCVVGLLATRSFILLADQFLGIKAQHAVPLLLVALAAVLGGATLPRETWERYQARAREHLRAAMNEPARFGLLILGIVALAGLALVIARTGNDSGVGVSGFEMKGRAILDRLLPVRPRTKEFLVGHPAFLLGLAWWWRGRRRLALPCFVVGSLGQVSLLNTFCHIHTPLVVSAWRDGIGLVLGTLIGILVFYTVELCVPIAPDDTSIIEEAAHRRDTLLPAPEDTALTSAAKRESGTKV